MPTKGCKGLNPSAYHGKCLYQRPYISWLTLVQRKLTCENIIQGECLQQETWWKFIKALQMRQQRQINLRRVVQVVLKENSYVSLSW